MVYVIGLTGGIGSGKSVVTSYFTELGVPIIDADDIAKELCSSKHPAIFQKIKKRFGKIVLNSNKEISRKKIREIIFENPDERCWLEDNLHPLIIDTILSWIKGLNASYCIVVAPLLLETDLRNYMDCVLVIDVPIETQIKRVTLRDNTNPYEVKKILNRQFTRKKRLEMADDVIFNKNGFEKLKSNVMRLNKFYLELAKIPR